MEGKRDATEELLSLLQFFSFESNEEELPYGTEKKDTVKAAKVQRRRLVKSRAVFTAVRKSIRDSGLAVREISP